MKLLSPLLNWKTRFSKFGIEPLTYIEFAMKEPQTEQRIAYIKSGVFPQVYLHVLNFIFCHSIYFVNFFIFFSFNSILFPHWVFLFFYTFSLA